MFSLGGAWSGDAFVLRTSGSVAALRNFTKRRRPRWAVSIHSTVITVILGVFVGCLMLSHFGASFARLGLLSPMGQTRRPIKANHTCAQMSKIQST